MTKKPERSCFCDNHGSQRGSQKCIEHLDGELTRKELQEKLGLKHDEYFRKAYLLPGEIIGVKSLGSGFRDVNLVTDLVILKA